jgi:hypothetical protein
MLFIESVLFFILLVNKKCLCGLYCLETIRNVFADCIVWKLTYSGTKHSKKRCLVKSEPESVLLTYLNNKVAQFHSL